MLKFGVIFVTIFMISCSKQIKVVENNKTLITIDEFPKSDTMIMVRDYFIQYRKDGAYIIGSVESPFTDGNGSFKSSSSVNIDITDGKLVISSEMF